MRRSTRAAALAAAFALILTACAEDDDPPTDDVDPEEEPDEEPEAAPELDLVADGELTVCSDLPYAPFEFEDPDAPSGYSGFDIDLMQSFADDLGLDLAVRAVAFESITSGVAMEGGDCDVAASAITITEDRAEALDFSDPYYDSLQSLLVATDSGIAGIDDTDGGRIGVQSGTTGEDYADDNLPDGAEIVRFESTGDLFSALDAASIEGILQDLPVNAERAREDADSDVVDTFDTGEQYGFATHAGREDALIETINDLLASLRDDGTYDDLYDQYFATD